MYKSASMSNAANEVKKIRLNILWNQLVGTLSCNNVVIAQDSKIQKGTAFSIHTSKAIQTASHITQCCMYIKKLRMRTVVPRSILSCCSTFKYVKW